VAAVDASRSVVPSPAALTNAYHGHYVGLMGREQRTSRGLEPHVHTPNREFLHGPSPALELAERLARIGMRLV